VSDTQPKDPQPTEARSPGPEARQKAVDALCDSFARDELEMKEFEERIELVHRVETAEQLSILLADIPAAPLPATRKGSASKTAFHPASQSSDLAPRTTLPADQISDHSLVVGVMGGGGRSGTWTPAKNNWALGVMGGCQLDFRDAQLGPGVTEVRVLAMMGGIEIVASPDVRVECSGIGIMGGFGIGNQYRPPADPNAPTIRITGLAIMGGVGVTIRHSGESAGDAKRRLKSERRARKLLEKGG
jgi:hypothetical protein